jgi:ribosomal protein S18 acetylase RimI-like enzyme
VTAPGQPDVIHRVIEYRRLERDDLARLGDIDRTERIDTLYVQHGARLQAGSGDWSASPWDADGAGPHSVARLREACDGYLAAGGAAWGAFDGERLVGAGIVVLDIRPRVAQLALLHVSDGYRRRGIGGRLSDELERIAREAGQQDMVVSATPSTNTVHFYLGRGFEPTAEPLPELFELEPEDIHMEKQL